MFEAFEFIPHEQDKLCYHKIIRLSPDLTQNLSPISSDPRRVCLCDPNGRPQCANLSAVFVNGLRFILVKPLL